MLTAEEIEQHHPGARWSELQVVAETGSTNDDLLARARDGAADRKVLVADSQRSGRGRLGRRWHSPPGVNLYLSLLWRTAEVELSALPPLALVAGLAVAEALVEVAGVNARLKWPNDVLIGGRKVAGVLAEAQAAPPALIIGVGVDVNQERFPQELTPVATSLLLATGEVQDRAALAAAVLRQLERRLDQGLGGGLEGALEEWSARSATLGQRVRASDGVEGVAEAVAPSGALMVRDAEGRRHEVIAGPIEAAD